MRRFSSRTTTGANVQRTAKYSENGARAKGINRIHIALIITGVIKRNIQFHKFMGRGIEKETLTNKVIVNRNCIDSERDIKIEIIKKIIPMRGVPKTKSHRR